MSNSSPFYRLILISGPPRAGKNRAAACLAEWLDGDHFALSNYVKRKTHEYYGLGTELAPLHFEDIKDLPNPHFGGLSARQAYISYSETVMKPKHGSGFLGKIAVMRIRDNIRQGRISIVSGVGFADEVMVMVNAVGASKVLHVILSPATGQDHDREDSRQPLDLRQDGVEDIKLVNSDCHQLIKDVTTAARGFSKTTGKATKLP